MAKFVKGEIVVLPFPFSDLSDLKKRPALVIKELAGDDLILCQITSQPFSDRSAIEISDNDFEKGGLHKTSYVRPSRLFTADRNIVLYKVGKLKSSRISFIIKTLIEIITD